METPTSASSQTLRFDPSKLIFSDEFDAEYVNTDIWQTEYRWGHFNNGEAQYYIPTAFEFRDGILRIKAEEQPMNGKEYTSGVLASYDKFYFTYGYVEIRAKVPDGQGLWPALWMLTQERFQPGEIDIMEILGHEPDVAYTSLHYAETSDDDAAITHAYIGPDFSSDFHLFAVSWEEGVLVWFIDNQEVFRLTHGVPDQPMYLLMNLAVGGEWSGYPNESTQFPAYFDIDYVRVYAR